MKHLLEYQKYSDEDIKGLMGDLEGVGQSTVAKASVWVEYTVRRSSDPYAIRKILTTDPFYVTGNEGLDSDLALKTISEGKFVEDSVLRPGGPESNKVQTFSKEKIKKMAKDCLENRDEDGVPMDPLEYFGSRFAAESIKSYNSRNPESASLRVDFSIFIAPPGDPAHRGDEFYTLPAPMNSIVHRVK
jgi:hypothetical protein